MKPWHILVAIAMSYAAVLICGSLPVCKDASKDTTTLANVTIGGVLALATQAHIARKRRTRKKPNEGVT